MAEKPRQTPRQDIQRTRGNEFPLLLHKSQGELAKLIHQPAVLERFMRCALTEFRTRAELADCNPQSIMASVLFAAQMNLEIGKGLRQGYLVPYKGECEFQVSYIGFMELARRTGYYKDIDAVVVCERDLFTYERDPRPRLYHKPDLWNPGAELGAYVYATLHNEEPKFLAMNRAEIETARKQSKNANGGPWNLWWGEMAKKTVLKRFLKTGPLSLELGKAFELDEADVANPVTGTATATHRPSSSRSADLVGRLRGETAPAPTPAAQVAIEAANPPEEQEEEIPFMAEDDVYASEGGAAN